MRSRAPRSGEREPQKMAAQSRRPADGLLIRILLANARHSRYPALRQRLPPTTPRSRAGSHADHRLTVLRRTGYASQAARSGGGAGVPQGHEGGVSHAYEFVRSRPCSRARCCRRRRVRAARAGGPRPRRRAEPAAVVEAAGRRPADARATSDASSLERYDRELVSFGTRHTLSHQDDPARGIGAARDWIKSEFDQIAATSGGRMTVELQSYVQAGLADPRPTRITNVVATLKGTDPTSADRVYVVGAHYDSRVTDVLDGHGDAPGANDDALGHLGRDRAGARDGDASDRGDDRVRRLRRRGAGPLRRQPLRRAGEAERLEHPGRAEHGHHRQPARRQRRPRPAQIRLFSEGVPTAETPAETARRQAIGGENDGVSRQLARYVKETGENERDRA